MQLGLMAAAKWYEMGGVSAVGACVDRVVPGNGILWVGINRKCLLPGY